MSTCVTIFSHQQRIDAAFSRASQLGSDPELQADFARYLCILVAGFIEKSLAEVALEHAKKNGSPTLQRYVERSVHNLTNANTEKVLTFVGAFSAAWRDTMEHFIVDERKAALDSVYGLRNKIAHGKNVGLTYNQISNYYRCVKEVVDELQVLCAA